MITAPVSAGTAAHNADFYLATISSVSASGARLLFDGSTEPTQKQYKCLGTPAALNIGDRVVVLKQSGTYVILGRIAAPLQPQTISDLPAGSDQAAILSAFNQLLGALRDLRMIY